METLIGTRFKETMEVAHLDDAIAEVFSLMMGVPCSPTPDSKEFEGAAVTAMIGFAGAMSGACVMSCEEKTALQMAECMVGIRPEAFDETVKDAIGEVCNMIAGAWKGKHVHLASGCMLSTPAVLTGSHYELHLQRPESCMTRDYNFDKHLLRIRIFIESMD